MYKILKDSPRPTRSVESDAFDILRVAQSVTDGLTDDLFGNSRDCILNDICSRSDEVYIIDCHNIRGWEVDGATLRKLKKKHRRTVARYSREMADLIGFSVHRYDWGKISYSEETGVVIIDFFDRRGRTAIRRVGHVRTLRRAAMDIQLTALDTSLLRSISVATDIARFMLINDLT
jgi:hypothetical protein